ncbi:hypothetical protein [Cohnella herbarum]|uniref:Uncharacterized protein n=1 Tax=Cohnella herbarum TaxID=2728023 RepID=A0A7Z2VQJ3_9BACL|nr:hypothetical protein [Cohnella herbarum]QJD87641.1 hypothetical protein HH215_33630 [Cohnella herbarum]
MIRDEIQHVDKYKNYQRYNKYNKENTIGSVKYQRFSIGTSMIHKTKTAVLEVNDQCKQEHVES